MEDKLSKKSKRLKTAIENYNKYKSFADSYAKTHSLDDYISFIKEDTTNMTTSLNEKYNKLILHYNNGNHQPLLSNLYERILALDEIQKRIASDIKTLLSET
jgi:hypothetical protein